MAGSIAIKRLTASDCTLFEGVFRRIKAGNQKSINLNADVLIGQLYPNLATVAAATNNEIALAISIYGPDAKDSHDLSRKIIKNATYKNWRLDGEFIPGPPGDIARYDNIQPGDLAVMVFRSADGTVPSGMDLIIVSKTDPADAALHSALTELFDDKSMVAVTSAQIAAAAGSASVAGTHPINIAGSDPETEAALEDASQGGFAGITSFQGNRRGRRVSASDLARAKARAEQNGRDGEGLVNGYLKGEVSKGSIASYKWVSAENAVAPYDFETFSVSGERTLVDAKTTSGPFDNAIHISLAEIVEASGPIVYRIYRVFDLADDGGSLRISADIRPLAKNLRTVHDSHMPAGIRVDSFSIATSALQWGTEKYIERQEEETD